MAELTFQVNGQSLTIQPNIGEIVEGSIDYLTYEAIFSNDWENYEKKYIFIYDGIEYERNDGIVPYQVIFSPQFLVRIEGENGISSITTNEQKVEIQAFSQNYKLNRTNGEYDSQLDSESVNAVQNKVLHKEFEKVSNDISALTTKTNSFDDTITSLQNTQASLVDEINDLNTAKNTQASTNEDFNARISEQSSQLLELQENISTNNTNIAELDMRINSIVADSETWNRNIFCYMEAQQPPCWYFSTDINDTYLNILIPNGAKLIIRSNIGNIYATFYTDGSTTPNLTEAKYKDFIQTDSLGRLYLKIKSWYTLYYNCKDSSLMVKNCTDTSYQTNDYIPLITPFSHGPYSNPDKREKGNLDSIHFAGPLANYLLQGGRNNYYKKIFDLPKLDPQIASFTSELSNAGKISGSFLFFTDPHWFYSKNFITNNTEDDFIFQQNEFEIEKGFEVLEYIYKKAPVDFIVCGGDWLSGTPTKSTINHALSRVNEETNKRFGHNYYPVLGNHDIWVSTTENPYLNKKIMKNLWFRNGVCDDKNNFYYDFVKNNIHYYVLDSGWMGDTEEEGITYGGTKYYNNKDWFTFIENTNAQVAWLENSFNSQKEDYAIVFVHICEKWKSETYITGFTDFLNKVLNKIESLNNASNKKFIALFSGHSHADKIYTTAPNKISTGYTTNYNHSIIAIDENKKVPSLSISGVVNENDLYTANACIPVIVTTTAHSSETGSFKGDLCFVDTEKKIIYLQRVFYNGNQGKYTPDSEAPWRKIDFSYLY